MKISKLFTDFFESEKAGGLLLIICTLFSLLIANSGFGDSYLKFWHFQFNNYSLEHWINDGLMAIFFLLVGLELEREVYVGELSSIKNASLPIVAAIGGMLVPALLYFILNSGTATQAGSGIPMATDIAFAIGVLSLLGNKVPVSLKIFLTALAVIDDLGAILVIAIFYTDTLNWFNLSIAGAIFVVLLILNKAKVRNLIPYLTLGVVMWYFMLHSGVHATITGVLVAFAIPFGSCDEKSTSHILQHILHKPVAFVILPLFALANTAVIFENNWQSGLLGIGSVGIIIGLVVGKPLGITLFSYLACKFKISQLPSDLNWKKIIGVGFLGGIGFTMSIFVTLLAYNNTEIINTSKIAILAASILAAIIGFVWLKSSLKE
ncbi:MAG: Na+/H+ antiporter NhaA [Bacteroidota bacterium]